MSAPRALDGIRVLDLADESAVLATRILADLGADVILVEPPGGSRARWLAPFLDNEPGPERSLVHQYYNANKRSLTLGASGPERAAQLHRLVASADVLVETAPPADAHELGLEPAALRAHNPGLIQVSVTPFGRSGEWRERRANDLVANAAGGMLWLSGEPGDPPVHGAANPSFTMASLAAATGVILALAARDRDPAHRGTHLDISLQQATAMAVVQTANPTIFAWRGLVPGRPGLSAALRCRDGEWVGFVPRPDRFQGFVEWVREAGVETPLGADDWPWARVGAPSQGNPVARATRELADRLTREEFMERAFALDLLCLPITDFPYMERHEHFATNEQFFELEHESLGRRLGFVRSPVDALERDIPIRRAPLLGEHQAELLEAPGPVAPVAVAVAAGSPTTSGLDPSPLHALEGVRVVDFCWVLAGPLGTRILANFGAEVIRIESSRRPDSLRQASGPDGKLDPDLAGLFNDANTGKRSFAVDLGQQRGRELVRELIATADVVSNNFRPGALERLGLGYAELRKLRHDIILLNMPGTHRRGPWSPRSTLGNTVMGASGYNHLIGFPHQRPRGLGVAYPDFTSPYLLATTVLAALRERDRTGRGQELDLSQLSGMISLLGVEWMAYRATGEQPARRGNRDPNWAPHAPYPTRGEDEWCAIAIARDEEWATLSELMQRSELAADPRFATHAARKLHEDELDAIVSSFTRRHDRWELAERLQRHGIAAAAVENLRDTFELDPQLRHHYQLVRQPNAPHVDIPVDGEAIRFAGLEHRLERAPVQGEHNEYVVCQILGISPEEYAELVVDGVLS
jgi:crotonobetainyl-CoA:carnitine CoA-transferase CaiB-like acyl-CoA transferase